MGAYAVYLNGRLFSDVPDALDEAEALRDSWRDAFVKTGHPPGVWRIERKVLTLKTAPGADMSSGEQEHDQDGAGRHDGEGDDEPGDEPHR